MEDIFYEIKISKEKNAKIDKKYLSRLVYDVVPSSTTLTLIGRVIAKKVKSIAKQLGEDGIVRVGE